MADTDALLHNDDIGSACRARSDAISRVGSVQILTADRRTIDRADRWAFRIEARSLLPNGGQDAVRDNRCEIGRLAQRCPNPMSPGQAADAFLHAHSMLTQPPTA